MRRGQLSRRSGRLSLVPWALAFHRALTDECTEMHTRPAVCLCRRCLHGRPCDDDGHVLSFDDEVILAVELDLMPAYFAEQVSAASLAVMAKLMAEGQWSRSMEKWSLMRFRSLRAQSRRATVGGHA